MASSFVWNVFVTLLSDSILSACQWRDVIETGINSGPLPVGDESVIEPAFSRANERR